ncbi:MAG: hypothetical protein RL667_963 [Pseudomonadota bacterium]
MRHARLLAYFLLASLSSPNAYAISAIRVQIDQLISPSATLKNADLKLDWQGEAPRLSLKAQIKPTTALKPEVQAKQSAGYMPFSLSCGGLAMTEVGQIDCLNGQLQAKQIQMPFSLRANIQPEQLAADLRFSDAQFSDASGLHAGDKLSGQISLLAKPSQGGWAWQGLLRWDAGELYWQPFYFAKAGNQLDINGRFIDDLLWVDKANLLVNGVGRVSAAGRMNTVTGRLEEASISGQKVDFAGLYAVFLKPMAEKSVFGDLTVTGQADWQFELKDGQPKSFELTLRDTDIRDNKGKFAFKQLQAHLPWDYDQVKTQSVSYASGQVLKLPLAKTQLQAQINRYALSAPKLSLPLLDGALNFTDLSAAIIVSMNLTPISMTEFSQALGWPSMQGKISGQVPQVSYADKQLLMNGAMTFNVFNGTVGMNHLKIDDPLGVVPRLYADLSMRQLDLGELTRTYSFGRIEGKLDGDVQNMQLENWKPVYLDASIRTSPGKQLKKISQRAVENITALGGEGTAAAVQRTFLQFFKEFNYDKIGLSCKLRQDVCEMAGVESNAIGYVIVKGQGLPAVNVNGYTQRISWSDLLARIKRITDGNSKPVIQ